MCPKCKNELSLSENTYGNEVYQRVISCDNCGFVYKFNATALDWYKVIQHRDVGAYESVKDSQGL